MWFSFLIYIVLDILQFQVYLCLVSAQIPIYYNQYLKHQYKVKDRFMALVKHM